MHTLGPARVLALASTNDQALYARWAMESRHLQSHGGARWTMRRNTAADNGDRRNASLKLDDAGDGAQQPLAAVRAVSGLARDGSHLTGSDKEAMLRARNGQSECSSNVCVWRPGCQ